MGVFFREGTLRITCKRKRQLCLSELIQLLSVIILIKVRCVIPVLTDERIERLKDLFKPIERIIKSRETFNLIIRKTKKEVDWLVMIVFRVARRQNSTMCFDLLDEALLSGIWSCRRKPVWAGQPQGAIDQLPSFGQWVLTHTMRNLIHILGVISLRLSTWQVSF